jgi:hypothetical protein
MDEHEAEAARYLAATLTMANCLEFCEGVGTVLHDLDKDRDSTTEALWKIRRHYDQLVEANSRLRSSWDDSPEPDKQLPQL